MIYLLDTNTCIQYMNRRSLHIYQRIMSHSPEDIAICDIVRFELYLGAYNSSRAEENLESLRKFFGDFVSLPFDGRAAEAGGRLRSQLKATGTPIGSYDIQIAVIALTHDLTLITHNTAEFSRVNELSIEDWEVEA